MYVCTCSSAVYSCGSSSTGNEMEASLITEHSIVM